MLWDSVEWSVRDNGTDFRCRPTHRYGDFFYPSADLRRPVSRNDWPLAFGAVLEDACRAQGLNPKVLPGPTGDWLRASLRRTFHGFVAWNELRRDLLRWLALDPLTLAIHRRIFEGSFAGIDTFDWVHRSRHPLSLVAIERPRMLPFLRYVQHEDGLPLQALEGTLREAGMTPKALAWMEKVGFPAFDPVDDFTVGADWRQRLVRHASRLERLRIESPSPIVNSIAGERLPDWLFRSLQREVERLLDEGVDEEDAIPGDFEEVARWIRTTHPEPDANQRRAGWAWLQAQARRARIHAAGQALAPGPCAYGAFSHEGLSVVPLASVVELREEALAMDNCLESYSYDFVIGEMQPFSVREAGTGRRLACFVLVREGVLGHWAVMQVAGPSNGAAPGLAVAAAGVACGRCNAVDAEARRVRALAARDRWAAVEGAAYEAANEPGREIGSPPARG